MNTDIGTRVPPFRDAEERMTVERILGGLAPGHPARAAFQLGAGTASITRLVRNPDLFERLQRAYVEALLRDSERSRPSLDETG